MITIDKELPPPPKADYLIRINGEDAHTLINMSRHVIRQERDILETRSYERRSRELGMTITEYDDILTLLEKIRRNS